MTTHPTTYDGNKLTRTLDSLGRVSTLVTKTSADVNLTTSYSYYNYGTNNTTTRLSSVTNPIGTYNYTYGALGNATGISGALTRSYTYDGLGQLTSVTAGSSTTNITYDTNGNILTRGDDVYTYENEDWPDQLTSYNGRTYTYDAIGNATSWRLGMTFTWQKGRQLSSVTRSGETYNYTYDSSGVRKSKTVDGVTTNFTYVDGKLIRQSDGTNIWCFYYDSDGSLLAMEYNNSMYFYQFDGLGNIVGLVDINGSVVASYVYDPWGRITSRSGSMNNINPFKFKGYYYDDETQIYYLMSRYYDPIVGRFISADSFASTGQGALGYNMYAYCNNNPVMYADPYGERYIAETRLETEDWYDRFVAGNWQRMITLEKMNPDPIGFVSTGKVYFVKDLDEIKVTFPGDIVVIDDRFSENPDVQIRNSYKIRNRELQIQVLDLIDQYEQQNPSAWKRNSNIGNAIKEWNDHNFLYDFLNLIPLSNRRFIQSKHVDIDNADNNWSLLRRVWRDLF